MTIIKSRDVKGNDIHIKIHNFGNASEFTIEKSNANFETKCSIFIAVCVLASLCLVVIYYIPIKCSSCIFIGIMLCILYLVNNAKEGMCKIRKLSFIK